MPHINMYGSRKRTFCPIVPSFKMLYMNSICMMGYFWNWNICCVTTEPARIIRGAFADE